MADKKLLMALVAKSKPKAEAPEEEAADMGDGVETAMKEFMVALESKDAAAMAEAFRSAVSMCHYGEE